ncbi:unnamed protein product [Linum tenue]|uniref:Cytochrome P450 n=1 Tax=Linum tenue TaxID=586396 RepID=A0AAV0IAS6_9ROSI|nr:unnamed protein product [Linum tenue]
MVEVTSDALLLLLLLLPISIIILFSTLSIFTKNNKAFPLPPGPWKLPIIGNIHQLATFPLVHRRLADLARRHGPVMHLQLGETSNVVVSSPESAKEFLKTHDHNFASRPYMPSAHTIFYDSRDIAFAPEGDYWRRMRKICTVELLSERRVRSLRPSREEEVAKLVRFIRETTEEEGGGMVNLSKLVISAGNAMTSRAAFGRIRKLEESFIPVLHRILKALGGFSVGDVFPSHKWLRVAIGTERHLRQLHEEADAILQEIIDEHVSRGRRDDDDDPDLVDVLLGCTDNHLEIKAVILVCILHLIVLDVFLAGADTSPYTVEWAMSELMRNPNKMAEAQKEVRDMFDKRGKVVDATSLDELQYLTLIIKETLRLHTPTPLLIPREARETVVISGYQVPAKTRVIVNSWAIGRNPEHWTQPDQFIPERFLHTSVDYKGYDFQYIPFGAGRRMCPGLHYGIATVRILLVNLLYHFDWKLPNKMKPEDLDMDEESGGTVARKNNLHLIPIPYHAP